jgi:hypothetical protein
MFKWLASKIGQIWEVFVKMYNLFLQLGAVALPLAVIVVLVALEHRDEGAYVVLWFLSALLIWLGWKYFDVAKRKIEAEDVKRDREQEDMKNLLKAIADNTKALMDKEDKKDAKL